MAWVRIDDTVPHHRKHLKAGPAAAWLWVCCLAYAQRHLTDGFVPAEALPMLGVVKGAEKLMETLVDVGLMERHDGGFLVHDYLDLNDTREEAIERRQERHETKAKAGRAGGLVSGQRRKQMALLREAEGQADNEAESKQAASLLPKQNEADGKQAAKQNEAPSHPIPSSTESPSDSLSREARFEVFWLAYPRKVGKDAARKAYERRKPGLELHAEMLTALERQKRSPQWQRDGGQYIPHPSTWLAQGRWQDDVGAGTGPSALGAARRWQWDDCPHTPHCGSASACDVRTTLEQARVKRAQERAS